MTRERIPADMTVSGLAQRIHHLDGTYEMDVLVTMEEGALMALLAEVERESGETVLIPLDKLGEDANDTAPSVAQDGQPLPHRRDVKSYHFRR